MRQEHGGMASVCPLLCMAAPFGWKATHHGQCPRHCLGLSILWGNSSNHSRRTLGHCQNSCLCGQCVYGVCVGVILDTTRCPNNGNNGIRSTKLLFLVDENNNNHNNKRWLWEGFEGKPRTSYLRNSHTRPSPSRTNTILRTHKNNTNQRQRTS